MPTAWVRYTWYILLPYPASRLVPPPHTFYSSWRIPSSASIRIGIIFNVTVYDDLSAAGPYPRVPHAKAWLAYNIIHYIPESGMWANVYAIPLMGVFCVFFLWRVTRPLSKCGNLVQSMLSYLRFFPAAIPACAKKEAVEMILSSARLASDTWCLEIGSWVWRYVVCTTRAMPIPTCLLFFLSYPVTRSIWRRLPNGQARLYLECPPPPVGDTCHGAWDEFLSRTRM